MLGLLLFAAVNFSACSSDDDDAPGSSSELVGLWECISSKGWEKCNGEIEDEWNETNVGLRVKLNADGSYAEYDCDGGEWEVDYTGKWEYKGNKIYLTYYDDYEDKYYTDFATVKELDANRVVLESTWEENDGGYIWEGYSLQVFKKID